ncbi:Ig-like domain-containing protein [Streptomyces scabiei]|uniref:Ig-like domain-containing protein n=1 Tax=Streptomyces scabiei TaxID=1930 RepID=UPI0036EE4494
MSSRPPCRNWPRATAVYSDGSTADKSVVWDASAVDFSAPGTYRVSGPVQTPVRPFPLARGYVRDAPSPLRRPVHADRPELGVVAAEQVPFGPGMASEPGRKGR